MGPTVRSNLVRLGCGSSNCEPPTFVLFVRMAEKRSCPMKKSKKSNGKQKEKNRKKTKQPPITSTSKMKEMKGVLKMALLVVGVILAMVVITVVILDKPEAVAACVTILEKILPMAVAYMTS